MKECPSCRLCFDDDSNHCPYDNAILMVTNMCGVTLDKRYTLDEGWEKAEWARFTALNTFT